jgi:hypothetical protein
MHTRSFLIFAALSLGAAMLAPEPVRAQDDQDELTHSLEHVERTLWHGWASNDTAPFEKSIVKASINVGPWGTISGKDAIVAMVSDHGCALEDVQFSDWKAHKVSEDTAILTYTAMQKGTCDGETLPENVAVSAVYVRHGDHWMSASYHETPLQQ